MDPVMSPRVGLVTVDGTGWPALPQSLGGLALWSMWYPCAVGEHKAREYRDAGQARLFVVVRLAMIGTAALVIVWVPSAARLAGNTVFDQAISHPALAPAILAQWPVVADGDALTVPSLDGEALAVWPVRWRQWGPGDTRPTLDDPGTPPTGAPVIGCVLA